VKKEGAREGKDKGGLVSKTDRNWKQEATMVSCLWVGSSPLYNDV